MCRLLKVSRNAFYHWCKYGSKQEDSDLLDIVKAVFDEHYGTYGTRRIKYVLENRYGWVVSRRRIAKAMRYLKLKAKSKRRFRIKTTDSKHMLPISPNLLDQDFYASTPGQVYAGDITYIRTKQGWLYLSVVIDLYARTVVGWAMENHMRSILVVEALKKAYIKRNGFRKEAIFHSDRGSQYASIQYRSLLQQYGIKQSMSAKGNCYDNAACESFFASLKTELPIATQFQTHKEVMEVIEEYIGFYNTKRSHSYNNYQSPIEAELKWWRTHFRDVA